MERKQAAAPPENSGSNRGKIFAAAVRLFASRGYESVSMRDIAAEVGIRASSIYNHFPAKAAILDEAIIVFRAEIGRRSVNEGREAAEPKKKKPEDLIKEIMLAPLVFLEDPALRDLVRVLARGQFFHEGVRDFLREEMFDKPGRLLIRLMEGFLASGVVKKFPAAFLAAELQAPMAASFYRHSLDPGGPWAGAAEIRAAMELHVDFFWRAAEKSP